MNFSLRREIYGANPWLVDSHTLPALLSILEDSKNGVKIEMPNQKYNSINVLDIKSSALIKDSWDLKNKEFTSGVGVINLDGAITVGGGQSSRGMIETSEMMLEMAQDKRIKGFVVYTNSGGGSSAAVSIMVDAINEVKKIKPIYGLIKKGGLAASAAYGILSATQMIFSESEMNIVGSVGTMIEFQGKAANTQDPDGTKNVRVYASKSTKKNIAFEEALNNDNYTLLINELLDPINENFISMVLKNRPKLSGSSFDDGHDIFAKDSIGTFIDGIASFKEVVQMVTSNNNNNSNLSLTSKSIKMTKGDLKQDHSAVYNEIVNEGIMAERERVASFMVYASADLEAVTTGIESGASITPSQREKFMVKMNSAQMLENLKSDSAKALVTEETKVKEEEVKEAINPALDIYSNIAKNL